MLNLVRPRFTRGHPDDEPFWDACVVSNEYRVTSFKPDGLIVDLGVSIGAFSAKAYLCGARNITGAEIDAWSYAVAAANLEGSGARIVNAAVVSPANDVGSTIYRKRTHSRFIEANDGVQVSTTTLDKLVGDKDVQFLKIDVEGSEWEILYTAECLDRIQEIAGEYHEPCPTWPALHRLPGLPEYSHATLAEFLGDHGFKTEFTESSEEILNGNFWAWRGDRTTVPPPPMGKGSPDTNDYALHPTGY